MERFGNADSHRFIGGIGENLNPVFFRIFLRFKACLVLLIALPVAKLEGKLLAMALVGGSASSVFFQVLVGMGSLMSKTISAFAVAVSPVATVDFGKT